jgi:hypothetical protein
VQYKKFGLVGILARTSAGENVLAENFFMKNFFLNHGDTFRQLLISLLLRWLCNGTTSCLRCMQVRRFRVVALEAYALEN